MGASEEEINRIADLARLPLPPEYQSFLVRMGRTPPSSLGQFFEDVSYGIEAVVQFYLNPPVPIPSDAVYLWTVDVDSHMFLGTHERGDEQRPILYFTWFFDLDTNTFTDRERLVTVIADSLLQYLYQEAFLRIRVPLLAYHAELRENVRTRKPDEHYTQQRRIQFQAVAERSGFEPVPFMNSDVVFYNRADAALMLYSNQVAEDHVHVSADDERECARLCEILSDNLDLRSLS
jgi:hypothetical protein